MKQQLDLVEVDQVTLENFFRGIQLDASFIPFHKYISQFAKVAIVSDGLDHAIDVATHNAAIPEMPIYANKLTFKPNGVSISYPYRNTECKAGNGVYVLRIWPLCQTISPPAVAKICHPNPMDICGPTVR